MTSVLLVGAGAVGARAARQLADTTDVSRVLIADRSSGRAESVAESLVDKAEATAMPTDARELPDVAAVALALPADAAIDVARMTVPRGIPTAAVADEELSIDALLALDGDARAARTTLAVGCALTPGLGEVLARHAADGLDSADDVDVARVGGAGGECIDAMRRMRKERPVEWHDRTWRSQRRLGPRLIWFPDPVGARECEVVAAGALLVRDAVPGVRSARVHLGEPPIRGSMRAMVRRKPVDDGWAGVRVEVWGMRDGRREAVVYGVVERPAVAAGTVLAVATASLAGALPGLELYDDVVGARGLGTIVRPTPFLAELARRGVTAATFEGVAAI